MQFFFFFFFFLLFFFFFFLILAISVHPLTEKYEKIILYVFISHIIFYKIISDR